MRTSSKNTIKDFSSKKFNAEYASLNRTFEFIDREFGRLNIDEWQGSALNDLRVSSHSHGVDEEKLAKMLEWWFLDTLNLQQSSQHKPRIDLVIENNARNNLRVYWYPRGFKYSYSLKSDETKIDYDGWRMSDVNEPNVIMKMRDIPSHNDERKLTGYEQFENLVLFASYAAFNQLKTRLRHAYDVRCITDLIVETESASSVNPSDSAQFRLKKWQIVNVQEYEKKIALNELDNIEKDSGIKLKFFVETWKQEANRKNKSGPTALPHTLQFRLTRIFKSQGKSIGPTAVAHYIDLITKYKPDLVPKVADVDNT